MSGLGGWDDFANNLATDLAPILQLFGEQVTTQYLAESTSVLDSIIFAMAPLGILTAIVSVIRVCGSPLLRAFIGRAQEGSGVAEVDLCSSTGRDIAELYQNGAITRVFGRPKILEFVHDPYYEHFYPRNEGETATAGIYIFSDYQRTARGEKEWMELGKSRRRKSSKEGAEMDDKFAMNPNMRLNIGFQRPSHWLLRGIAVFGTLLQASMLGFAIWATAFRKLLKEDALPPPWALPTTVVGTVILSAGMFMCSALIEQSTIERTFKRRQVRRDSIELSGQTEVKTGDKSSKTSTTVSAAEPARLPTIASTRRSHMYWIQPGGQVVGDQTFDSFAYSDAKKPLRYYTTSWRRPVTVTERNLTWVASLMTITGFILQFVGLRGVHSSISVYQVIAVMIMSVLRASIRTKRLDATDNLLSRSSFDQSTSTSATHQGHNKAESDRLMSADLEGHELDWLTFEIYRSRQHDGDAFSEAIPTCSWRLSRWNPGHTEEGACPNHIMKIGNTAVIWASFGQPKEDRQWLLSQESGEDNTQPNIAAMLWHFRARLSQLTSVGPTTPALQVWTDDMVESRSGAIAAALTISTAASVIFSDFDGNLNGCRTLYAKFGCASEHQNALGQYIPLGSGDSDHRSSHGMDQLFFSLYRERDEDTGRYQHWRADTSQIEAAIALGYWSCLAQYQQLTSHLQEECRQPFQNERIRRILGVTNPNIEDFEKPEERLQAWACAQSVEFPHIILDFNDASPGYTAVWKRSPDDYMAYIPVSKTSQLPRHSYRFFGWNAIPWGDSASGGEHKVFISSTQNSIPTMCAQEMFSSFLWALLVSSEKPLGESTFTTGRKGYGIENPVVNQIIDAFVENGLGSKTDAILCIIPTIVAWGSNSPVRDAFDKVVASAAKDLSNGDSGETENKLQWARNSLMHGATVAQIWEWFLTKSWFICWELKNRKAYKRPDEKFSEYIIADLKRSESVEITKETRNAINHLFVRLRIVVFQRHLSQSFNMSTSEMFEALDKESKYPSQTTLARDKDYARSASDCVDSDDPYGVLVYLHEVMSGPESTAWGLLIDIVQRHSPEWQLVIREITKRCPYCPVQDQNGRDAFSWAFAEGNIETVRQLLVSKYGGIRYLDWQVETISNGAGLMLKTDKKLWTAIHYAIANNRLDVIKLFTDNVMRWWLAESQAMQLFEAFGTDGVSDKTISFFWQQLGPQLLQAIQRFANDNETRTKGEGVLLGNRTLASRGLKHVQALKTESESAVSIRTAAPSEDI